MAVDDLVESITLFQLRPIYLHGYLGPFLLLYGAFVYLWAGVYGFTEHFEGGCIGLAIIGLLQILTCLFCHWFVSVRCLLTCSKVASPLDTRATVVCVRPTPNNGWPELLPLVRTKDHEGKPLVCFTFQKVKYLFDGSKFHTVRFPVDRRFSDYHRSVGLESEADINEAQIRYGDNKCVVRVGNFKQTFRD